MKTDPTGILSLLFVIAIMMPGCKQEDDPLPLDASITLSISPTDAFEVGDTVPIAYDIHWDQRIDRARVVVDREVIAECDAMHCAHLWYSGKKEPGIYTACIIAEKQGYASCRKEFTIRLYTMNEQPCPCDSTVTDVDGNVYRTIQIGDQCWMKENMKAIRYADGSPLVDGTGAGNTQYDTVTKYYFNYGDDEANVDTYGRLYIWMAAVNGEVTEADLNPSGIQGICPDGWHVPSDAEWRQLEIFLGMPAWEAVDREWRGTVEGGMLKEQDTAHWKGPNLGATNETGFTALPGGHRNMTGDFYGLGTKGSFWTATNHVAYNMTQNPAFRLLHSEEARLYRYRGFHGYITYARSVRCVKDGEKSEE